MNRSSPIITSLNRKGGVGKTHLCWLVASLCEEQGKRCLICDLDPQANITGSFLDNPGAGRTIEELFDPTQEPDAAPLIRSTGYGHIDLLPASPRLEALNLTQRSAWEQTDLQQSLKEALAPVARNYDYILLDCPPSLSLVSYAALTASNFVMIPLESAQWGAIGTQHIIQAVQDVQRTENPNLQLLGYVLSRFKRRRSYQQSYEEVLREQFGEDVFQTVIPDLAAFEKAVTDRTPITLHSPSSHASSIAREFFTELETRIEKLQGGRESLRAPSLSKAA